MKTLKHLFVFAVLIQSFIAGDFVLRALPVKNPMKMNQVESVKMVVTPEFRLFFRVDGASCLEIQEDQFCDFIQHDYDVPEKELQLTEHPYMNGMLQIHLVKDEKALLIGEVEKPEGSEFQVELNEQVALFFDRLHDVPALLFLENKKHLFKMARQKRNFQKFFKELM